jgi:protein ImuA
MNNTLPSAGKRPAILHRLRQAVAKIEGQETVLAPGRRVLSFDVAEIDRVLAGGLAPASLHEIAARTWPDLGAAIGFALALAARARDQRETLWIQTDFAALESGNLYGPGLEIFGLPCSRLLILKASHPLDALWAMEESLKCRALSSVVCEFPNDAALADLTTTQRLTHAARECGLFGFLLRHRSTPLASSADTRWKISTASSVPDRFGGIGRTTFAASLVKNRRGPGGQWTIVWDHHERTFSTLSRNMAPPAFDRSGRTMFARIA